MENKSPVDIRVSIVPTFYGENVVLRLLAEHDDKFTLEALGFSPKDAVFRNTIDISKSLAPYVIIYDASEKPIASGAVLDGKTPNPKKEAFDFAKKTGENRFTWEAKKGVRSAVVLAYYKGKDSGFVLAGRSLKEVEKRESQLGAQVVIAWIIILVASLTAVIVSELILKNIKLASTKAKK